MEIGGDFLASGNPNLKRILKNSSIIKVGGNLICDHCNLDSLEGMPVEIGGDFICNYNEDLKSLKGGPKKVGGDYIVNDCGLEDIEGLAEEIKGDFNCKNNKKLTKEYVENYIRDNNIKIGGKIII